MASFVAEQVKGVVEYFSDFRVDPPEELSLTVRPNLVHELLQAYVPSAIAFFYVYLLH